MDDSMKFVPRLSTNDGGWDVVDKDGKVLARFSTNEEAWCFVNSHQFVDTPRGVFVDKADLK